MVETVTRRGLVALGVAGSLSAPGRERLVPIVIRVRAMFDQGAHSGKGLREDERAAAGRYQEKAGREYAASGILFDFQVVEGAYLRTQGYSEIPEKFLARNCINLFVTQTLAYDIDRDRTGGCSIGPRRRGPKSAGDPFYRTFLGLRDASETTLAHEYAHHFALDTTRSPTATGNLWADLRNDYWLWRQRHGYPVMGFRACGHSEFATLA